MARGHSFWDDGSRCPRCAIRVDYCICDHIPRISTRTRICVVRHVRELQRPSGTARIAALAMPELALIDYRDEAGEAQPVWMTSNEALRGHDARPPEEVAARLRALEAPCLLFPSGRAAAELVPWPRTLIVLDATWRQAREMYKRIPGLAALPAMRLHAEPQAVLRLRRATGAQRSTLEAIAEAVALLEGEEAAAPLHALHARFVENSLRARGRFWSSP